MKKPITAIITHEHPDLDAILSTYLLKRFGDDKFTGVKDAEILFCPAGKLPKSPDQLENEGVIAVDIGGGRFDSHPVVDSIEERKRERCATDLVGQSVGVIDRDGWCDLIEYTRLHDTTGRNIQSKDFLHHLPTIMTALYGSEILFENQSDKSEQMMNFGFSIFDALAENIENEMKNSDVQSIELLIESVDRYLTKHSINKHAPPPEYGNFVKWYYRLIDEPDNAFSSEELDDSISLESVIVGIWHLVQYDSEQLWLKIEPVFDAILARESRWIQALSEIKKNSKVYEVEKPSKKYPRMVKIVTIESINGMVIRAARYRHQADMIIYRDPSKGATSILLNRKGPLMYFQMEEFAGNVRWMEGSNRHETLDLMNLKSLGKFHGWFLHQSLNLLICGSQKATDFIPSKISMEDLAELAMTTINRKYEGNR